ncbi:MAG: hypothetical protein JXR37_17820 [Kiritimatiellae bacterium]|nr:hypothetical protein [Kiritimatiellia bacterium]
MRKTGAIAVLAVRCAVRSRVFVCIAGLAVLVMVGLPLTVKGDGTGAGRVQILLRYTLGGTWALLAAATIWSASASVAQEVADRQLLLVLSKPVHRFQLWIGKWLGIVLLDAVLVGLVGGGTYALLRWTIRRSALPEADLAQLREETLGARRLVSPKAGAEPAGVIVPPGAVHRWVFEVPRRPASGRHLALRFRLVSSRQREKLPVHGVWLIGPAGAPDRHRRAAADVPGVHQFSFPARAVAADNTVTVEYGNTDPSGATTVVFDSEQAVVLLVAAGSFEMNYVRALMVMLLQLAFLAACGLLAGSLLSFPVAVFVSCFVLLLTASHGYISAIAARGLFYAAGPAQEADLSILDYAVAGVFKVLDALVRPVTGFDPLALLPQGLLVSWATVGRAFLVLVVLYSGVLALLSVGLFARREIG